MPRLNSRAHSSLVAAFAWVALGCSLATQSPPAARKEEPPKPNTPNPSQTDPKATLLKLSLENDSLLAAIQKADPKDPRILFLRIQALILRDLPQSPFFSKDKNEIEWLARVTTRFMNSFDQAMKGNIADESTKALDHQQQWKDVWAGRLGGFWWNPAIQNCKTLGANFKAKPLPSPQLDEIVAVTYMIAHIEFDLRMALIAEGVGTDAGFDEVGRIVQDAYNKTCRYPEIITQMAPAQIDPLKRRAAMRDEVKQYLKSHSINKPYQGLIVDGTPEAKAFEGAPGVPATKR